MMFIGTNGIVVDNKGRVLLILRDDTRTWAIPGGALEAGELPTTGVAREVEEETGIAVQPARLVGLYHWNDRTEDFLALVFRCLIEGGEITQSEESIRVAFSQTSSLPKPMLSLHKERLARALIHKEGAPHWGEQSLTRSMILWRRIIGPLIYRSKDARRRIRGEPAYQPPMPWSVGAFVVIQDDAGGVLWLKRTDYEVWNLPGGGSEPGEAPWTTAIRETQEEAGVDVELTGCSGIYVKPKQNLMIFTFSARIISGGLTTGDEAAAFSYFTPGREPDNSLPKHIERVADAISSPGETFFKIQDSPHGLEVLGLSQSTA
jgi:8-oxo-dGTP diphosphatase